VQEETPGIVRKILQGETPSVVQKELKSIKQDISKITKDINLVVRSFDRDSVALRKNVENHIDHHPYPIAS